MSWLDGLQVLATLLTVIAAVATVVAVVYARRTLALQARDQAVDLCDLAASAVAFLAGTEHHTEI